MNNKDLTISLIITTYKDIVSLGLILDALKMQTYKKFEVVIAEDDDSSEVKKLLENYKDLNIKHICHEDKGRRKLVIQNKAICASSGNYLIFIDGDCVPYSTFVYGHFFAAKKNTVLTGRRVNLPKLITEQIKEKKLTPIQIEKNYLTSFFKFIFDKEIEYKEGVYLNPKGILFKVLSRRKKSTALLGCNFSCFKEDMININGFDEDYGDSIMGQEDTDIDWRFKGMGCEMESVKNIANVLHLYHERSMTSTPERDIQGQKDWKRMHELKELNKYRCDSGVNNYC